MMAVAGLIGYPVNQSEEVLMIGAANVLTLENGLFSAGNTDTLGIKQTFNEQGFTVKGARVRVLGAGGVARALCYVLGNLRAHEVEILNRSHTRAESVAKVFAARFPLTRFFSNRLEMGLKPVAPTQLYVNCASDLSDGLLSEFSFRGAVAGALAFDLRYKSGTENFLDRAAEAGLKTVNGLDMLIWQAIATFEIWFGPVPSCIQEKQGLKKKIKDFLEENPK